MVLQSDTQAPKPAQHFVRIGSPWLTQVDAAKPNSVLLVSAPAATRSAVWGGLMTARAQSLGVQGVVLDGRCRDLSEHRASRFPVRGILSRISNPQLFARGHSVLGQSPFTRPSELEVPLEICDPTVPRGADGTPTFAPVVVHPGDVLLADIDGVVSVPQALAEEVVSLATEGRRVDDLCMADLRAGHGVRETFTKHRGRARQ